MSVSSHPSARLSGAALRIPKWIPRDRDFWLALLLTVPAMLPLFAPGYFMKAHDARHSIFFLVEFDRSFSEGALWPIWGPDHAIGFGYPTFLLYAPLAFFVGEVFHLLGLGFAWAIKATWALGFLLGAIGSYRLARRWFRPAAALVASLAFTYAPYHLSQIYVRASLAEFMALAWLPWVVLAFLSLWEDPGPRHAALAGLSLAALMLFHTVSTLTLAPLIGAILLTLLFRDILRRSTGKGYLSRVPKLQLLWSSCALILSGLLSCIFFVPMLLERGAVAEWQWVKETYNYALHFVYPGQFLSPTWGYGYSVEGPGDGMSFQIGAVIFVLAVLGLGAVVARRLHPERIETQPDSEGSLPGQPPFALFVLLAITTVVVLFMMTPAARPLWDILPLVELVQFPWRLLAVTSFTLSLLAAFGVSWLTRRGEASQAGHPSPYPYIVSLILVVTSLPFTQPELVPLRAQDESPVAVLDFELAYPDMRGMTRWAERPPINQDSPLIDQYLAGEPLQKAVITSGAGRIMEQDAGAISARALVVADEPVSVQFYTYYFPGWRAVVDDVSVPIRAEGPNGLITLDVPAGEHEVEVVFRSTPPRVVGAILSGLGLLATLLLLIFSLRRQAAFASPSNLR